jgi:hypothetical protein
MAKSIDSTTHYVIKDEQHHCCGELQFRYVCKKHQNRMGCMFCEFDPYNPCDC